METVFISSVQKELAEERRALKDYIEGDALLRRFFDVFLFEDLPAAGRGAFYRVKRKGDINGTNGTSVQKGSQRAQRSGTKTAQVPGQVGDPRKARKDKRLRAKEPKSDDGTGQVAARVGTKSGPSRDQVEAQVAGEVTGEVSGEVLCLLRALSRGPLSRSDAQADLGLRGLANFRDRYLEPALEFGLVEMTIPDKPRSSKQKYRLTNKGRALLEGAPE